MKYMLLVYSNEQLWTEEEWGRCTAESTELCHELNAKHQFQGASPLHPVSTAKSVQVRTGQPLVTDGPFAETTEQLGGYFIIEVPDLDHAIDIAARLPTAKKGTVEIRPLVALAGLPGNKSPQSGRGLKRFMLLCYDDEKYWCDAGEAAHQAARAEAVELARQLDARGQYLAAAPLHPVQVATSVRVRADRRSVTDGPFAETREVLGGFYLIQTHTIDEAVEIAERHPGARVGTVEVREVFELSSLPSSEDPSPRAERTQPKTEGK